MDIGVRVAVAIGRRRPPVVTRSDAMTWVGRAMVGACPHRHGEPAHEGTHANDHARLPRDRTLPSPLTWRSAEGLRRARGDAGRPWWLGRPPVTGGGRRPGSPP